jgi:hypothetical protein
VLPILSLLLSPIGGVVVWLTVSAGKHSLEYQREAKRVRRQLRAAELERRRHKAPVGADGLDVLTARLKQSEALVAERDATIAALHAQLAAAPEGGAAFRRLRTLVLHELHPDHAPEGSPERTLRKRSSNGYGPRLRHYHGDRNGRP